MGSTKFEMSIPHLRARRNAKWTQYGDKVIPAWVAEMDFHIAPPVQQAIEKIVNEEDYGYPRRNGLAAGTAVADAFVKRMRDQFGWQTDPDLVLPIADLVQGTYAPLCAFSEPDDGIILQTPAYPPFYDAIKNTGRRLIKQQLVDRDGRYQLDLAELERLIDETTKIVVLCNPHNPTGRAFSKDDLIAVGNLAIKHDLIVVSDEIHADLVFDDNRHIPLASLSPEIAAHTVTLNSATKSFNIPGLRCAVIHFGTADLRDRFYQVLPPKLLGAPSIIGIDATVSAWLEGQDWLDSTLKHLKSVRNHCTDRLQREIPEIQFRVPEATYMMWLDCSELGLQTTAFDFFHNEAGLAFSPGETFEDSCGQFIRFNFATSMEIADEILDRMVSAVRRNTDNRKGVSAS